MKLTQQLFRKVSNYSDLTQSVGSIEEISDEEYYSVSNYSDLTQSVGVRTRLHGKAYTGVSNYSDLTQSVGTYEAAKLNSLGLTSFQLFRFNPIGGANEELIVT